jgi:hypothetical protein
MKKVLFILCFVSMIFSQQDTLITKQGKIYSEKIINNHPEYIEFQLENWTSSNKIQRNGIKKLISADGIVLIENNGEAVKNENPLVGKITDFDYSRYKDSFGLSSIGGALIGLSGIILYTNNQRTMSDDITLDEIQDFSDKTKSNTDLSYILLLLGGLLIAFDNTELPND